MFELAVAFCVATFGSDDVKCFEQRSVEIHGEPFKTFGRCELEKEVAARTIATHMVAQGLITTRYVSECIKAKGQDL